MESDQLLIARENRVAKTVSEMLKRTIPSVEIALKQCFQGAEGWGPAEVSPGAGRRG
jgi:hypothetical protein